ncbi:MAG: nucleotide exchange factor GrpE [Gammaproteobacteria bacterium]|nr:nucleotide exchange factor GrpE [Gammaproteobacteria bacterium]
MAVDESVSPENREDAQSEENLSEDISAQAPEAEEEHNQVSEEILAAQGAAEEKEEEEEAEEEVEEEAEEEAEEEVAAPETEEITVEDIEEAPSVEELAEQLEAALAKLKDQEDALLRQKAEQENLRKRMLRAVEDAHKYGLKDFAVELLPIKDSMEMGLEAASDDNVDVATLREGNALTLKMLESALAKFGIEQIDPQKEKFDPKWHEAMTMAPDPDLEPGSVLHVHQKGYHLNQRLLRPARVVVSKAVDKEQMETPVEIEG